MRRENEQRPRQIDAAFEQAQRRRGSGERDAFAAERDARADHRAAEKRQVQPPLARVSRRKVLPVGRTSRGNLYIRCGGRRIGGDPHAQKRRVPARIDQLRPDDARNAVDVGDRDVDRSTTAVLKDEAAGLGRGLNLGRVGRVVAWVAYGSWVA